MARQFVVLFRLRLTSMNYQTQPAPVSSISAESSISPFVSLPDINLTFIIEIKLFFPSVLTRYRYLYRCLQAPVGMVALAKWPPGTQRLKIHFKTIKGCVEETDGGVVSHGEGPRLLWAQQKHYQGGVCRAKCSQGHDLETIGSKIEITLKCSW